MVILKPQTPFPNPTRAGALVSPSGLLKASAGPQRDIVAAWSTRLSRTIRIASLVRRLRGRFPYGESYFQYENKKTHLHMVILKIIFQLPNLTSNFETQEFW